MYLTHSLTSYSTTNAVTARVLSNLLPAAPVSSDVSVHKKIGHNTYLLIVKLGNTIKVLLEDIKVSSMRVTIKGQVTIPRNIREMLGISPETEVDFKEENGRVYIVKVGEPTTATGKFHKFRGIATAKMSTDQIMGLTRES